MEQIIYDFSNITDLDKFTNYICQSIHGRKLSDICHSHTFYEIIIVLKGSCVQVINGKSYDCSADTMYILAPGDFHVFLSQSEDIHIVSLSVTKTEFENFCFIYGKNLPSKIKTHFVIPYDNARSDLSVKCSGVFSRCDEYECKFLLSLLLKNYVCHIYKSESTMPQSLSFAMTEIKKPSNLKEGVSAFIKLSNYSRTQLSRLMKQYMNTTIHEYITALKLDSAYRDLLLTNKSIEEIAEDAGYSSVSHFNKIFKNKFNQTPAALRKNCGIRTI